MDKELREIINILFLWASSKDEIIELIIFGSRVKGNNSKNSDLDIAINTKPILGDSNAFTTFISEKSRWLKELEPKLPQGLVLDINFYNPIENPNSIALLGVKEASILVYKRY